MIVLSGASASGKTEVAKLLAKKYGICKVITTTTRNMRVHEINGKDYFFVDMDTFKQMIKDDKFVEYTFFNEKYYGSTKDQIADDKCIVVDNAGLKAYTQIKDKNIITFFLDSTEETRFKRMIERGDDINDAKKRLINDRTAFDKKTLCEVDYHIDSETQNVEQVTDQVYKIAKSLNK